MLMWCYWHLNHLIDDNIAEQHAISLSKSATPSNSRPISASYGADHI